MKYLKKFEGFDFFKKKKSEFDLTESDIDFIEEIINGTSSDLGLNDFTKVGRLNSSGMGAIHFISNIIVNNVTYNMRIFPKKENEYHIEFNQLNKGRNGESDFLTQMYSHTTSTPNKAIQWFSEIVKDPNSIELEKYKY